MIADCTRCRRLTTIRLADTLTWGVKYRLCGGCLDFYRSLDEEGMAAFAVTLWQLGAVQSLNPMGRA